MNGKNQNGKCDITREDEMESNPVKILVKYCMGNVLHALLT